MERAIGYRPGLVPGTDQERIQNLPEELAEWLALPADQALVWEVSEKLEGEATSYAQLAGAFQACSSEVSFKDLPSNSRWALAHRVGLPAALQQRFGDVALQGELIGPGLEGNHYGLAEPAFYLYRVFLVDQGRTMDAAERRALAAELGLHHVPVVHERFVFDASTSMESLLAMADGPSLVNPKKRREGLVFKELTTGLSFKVISNKYLLNEKL
jgi:RNA ligase (TIGR02306 family)